MLAVQGISKRFAGERAVDAVNDLSLNLEKGRFLAIMGRSGSGKSTLLGMIGGISRPTSGTVTINGIDHWLLDDGERSQFRNRSIGFVFQFASLLPTLRAIDNVALPALVGGVLNYKEAYARAHALLDSLGLADRFDFYPAQLSGGEQRRVAIARALINAPDLLLADEPTADLDELTENEILNQLIDIHRAFNLTLVIVTHNPAIALRADQLVEMHSGRVVARQSQLTSEPPSHQENGNGGGEEGVRSLFQIPAHASAKEAVTLGMGIERFIGRFVLWMVPILALIWGVNAAVTYYQDSVVAAKAAQHQALEELAMKGLRADIKDVAFGPGKSYVLSLYMRNTTGEQSIYVMSPTVRGFIQVGSNWQEVPLKPLDNSQQKVRKVVGEEVTKYALEPDVPGFAQLLPYYMHIRISSDMLVSPSSQPKDDLIERNDSYYVYLKPHNANDAAILGKLKFPGAPPVWIPMPPH